MEPSFAGARSVSASSTATTAGTGRPPVTPRPCPHKRCCAEREPSPSNNTYSIVAAVRARHGACGRERPRYADPPSPANEGEPASNCICVELEKNGEDRNDGREKEERPAIHDDSHWQGPLDLDSFNTVDNKSKLVCTWRWRDDGPDRLSYWGRTALRQAEKSLITRQKEQSIALVASFSKESKLSQIPYRKDLDECSFVFCNVSFF